MASHRELNPEGLIQGEPLATQLAAVIARLESAWNQLCPTLPVWRQEAVPTREIDGSRAPLNGWRPLPAPQPAELSPWHPLRTRFANGAARFIDRPSPYAVPAPPTPTPLGLPGNWDPAGSPGSQYLRWTHEYVLGAVDLATGLKRPRLRDDATRIALHQAIWDIVLGGPAFERPTPAAVVRHGVVHVLTRL